MNIQHCFLKMMWLMAAKPYNITWITVSSLWCHHVRSQSVVCDVIMSDHSQWCHHVRSQSVVCDVIIPQGPWWGLNCPSWSFFLLNYVRSQSVMSSCQITVSGLWCHHVRSKWVVCDVIMSDQSVMSSCQITVSGLWCHHVRSSSNAPVIISLLTLSYFWNVSFVAHLSIYSELLGSCLQEYPLPPLFVTF